MIHSLSNKEGNMSKAAKENSSFITQYIAFQTKKKTCLKLPRRTLHLLYVSGKNIIEKNYGHQRK
jgi:hypothetical protein